LNICVLGDGGWGTTLALNLHSKGNKVSLWGAFPEYVTELKSRRENYKFLPGIKLPTQIEITSSIDEAVADKEIIVVAIPSRFLRSVIQNLVDVDLSSATFVSATKGIEDDTLLTMSQVIFDVLGIEAVGILSGPTISYEVARGIPTTAVISSKDRNLAERLQNLFTTSRFRIYTNPDPLGVELAGALKNIIAIASGICDGLKFGTNTKAALIARGLVEMTRLGVSMGAQAETFYGIAGLGDLVTTCISTHGRNRWVGEQLGKGRKLADILLEMEMVAEGIYTTKAAYKLAKRFKVEMPISEKVYCVLYEDASPAKAVDDLMLRDMKAEGGN
jgi:glycerol-3-phosphate dehydrogenase (NAD(P)+)